jgi:hypothetical protein
MLKIFISNNFSAFTANRKIKRVPWPAEIFIGKNSHLKYTSLQSCVMLKGLNVRKKTQLMVPDYSLERSH